MKDIPETAKYVDYEVYLERLKFSEFLDEVLPYVIAENKRRKEEGERTFLSHIRAMDKPRG